MSSERPGLRPAHESLVGAAQAIIDGHRCTAAQLHFGLQLQLREHDVIPDSHLQEVLVTIAKAGCVLYKEWPPTIIGFFTTQLGHDVSAITAIVGQASVEVGTDHIARFEEDEAPEDAEPAAGESGQLRQVISARLLGAMDRVVRAINLLVTVNGDGEMDEVMGRITSAHPYDDLRELTLSLTCRRHDVILRYNDQGPFIFCVVDPSVIIEQELDLEGERELEDDEHEVEPVVVIP